LAGTMQADLGRAFHHGDLHSASGADYERQALIADAIIARADPELHRQNIQRNEKLVGKEASGTNRQRDSVAYGNLRPHRRDYYGSAPRADIER